MKRFLRVSVGTRPRTGMTRVVRASLLAVIALTLALGATACGSGSDTKAGSGGKPPVLTFGLSTPPASLNPPRDGGGIQSQMHFLAYETPMEYNRDGSYAPGLATSWRYLGS